jgi:hypothetical protein
VRARLSVSSAPTKRVVSMMDVSVTPGQIAVTVTRPCQSARRLCENARSLRNLEGDGESGHLYRVALCF